MDFDDLDDEIEKRVADGEEVACRVIENDQPVQGTVLPLMKRSLGLPPLTMLPQRALKDLPPWNGKPQVDREPVLRLLCIHGAADHYEQDWYQIESEAPDDIEVATHLWPGHGFRKDEPMLTTLEELADDCFEFFREPMNTGSFALLGHSIGALMAILVAKRAREELGVEPVFVIMLERGAANHKLFTECGADRLKNDPVPFFRYWNPMMYTRYEKGGEQGKATLDMWAIDQYIDQFAIELGFHTFKCPLLALQASHSVDPPPIDLKKATPEERDFYTKLAEVGLYKKVMPDGSFFHGHFPAWTYDDWPKWTDHPAGCKVELVPDTNHSSIKASPIFKQHVWDSLRKVIDTFRVD